MSYCTVPLALELLDARIQAYTGLELSTEKIRLGYTAVSRLNPSADEINVLSLAHNVQ